MTSTSPSEVRRVAMKTTRLLREGRAATPQMVQRRLHLREHGGRGEQEGGDADHRRQHPCLVDPRAQHGFLHRLAHSSPDPIGEPRGDPAARRLLPKTAPMMAMRMMSSGAIDDSV